EGFNAAVLCTPNADAFLDSGKFVSTGVGPRLRVRDVDRVVLRNENPAWSAKLTPLIEELTILIKNLDAVVLAITYKQTSPRIHRDRVRFADFAGSRTFLSPLLEELSIPVELNDTIVLPIPVAVGDEDVAVRRNHDVRRLVEKVGP